MAQPTNQATNGYNISIAAKHIAMTEAIKTYVIEKMSKVERFTDQVLDLKVTLDIQKLQHIVTAQIKFSHFKIYVHATLDDLYAAIDKVADRLTKLVRKYKNKLQDHVAKPIEEVDMQVNVLSASPEDEVNDAIEEENARKREELFSFHQVVSKETMPLKVLREEEAVMKMELSGDSFLVYQGEEDQKIKVIYRREDDNFGVIDIKAS